MSFEHQIGAQQTSLDLITRIWVNYQKLALPKRTLANARSRLDRLEEYWRECRQQHYLILSTADDKIRTEHPYFTADLFGQISDKADEVRDNLNDAIDSLLPRQPSAKMADPTVHPVTRTVSVNLNPINIRKFAGNISAWPGFRDLFTSLVGSRSDFTDVQKLHYLKDSLEGTALQLLINTEVTEANYRAAWELLQERYENPRAIAYALFDKFLHISKVGSNRESDLRNLRDQSHHIYHAILSLSRPIHLWEDQFVHLILSKLDAQTRHEWELTQKEVTSFPTFKEVDSYLSLRLRAYEAAGTSYAAPNVKNANIKDFKKLPVRAHQSAINYPSCFVCAGDHPLFQCPAFNNKSVAERISLVLSQERCLNCFRKGHRPKTCESKNTCRICKQKHHTLVHSDKAKADTHANPPSRSAHLTATAGNKSEEISSNCAARAYSDTVLPTAIVLLRGSSGRALPVRALLDQGSQASFIAESVVQSIKPIRKLAGVTVSGIGAKELGTVRYSVSFTMEPSDSTAAAVAMTAFVLPKLSSYLPPLGSGTRTFPHLESLRLADPAPASRNKIQLIIGADFFGSVLREGLVRGPPGTPVAQLTIFGWIISGQVPHPNSLSTRLVVNHVTTGDDLRDPLTQFWELEEIPKVIPPSQEELRCEQLFLETHTRLPDGRYQDRLPLKTDAPLPISSNKEISKRIYLRQELRLRQTPDLERAYQSFLIEYHDLGHMETVPSEDEHKPSAVYLPHHAVVKPTSTTTKVRVVFNGSFSSKPQPSLNDHLMVGPKLQADLFALVLRWRSHRYVLTTDIAKMFRQISIAPEDRDLQRIIWRPSPQAELQSFRLCTVTYGTACAPFLANRVVRQLAVDEGASYPLAAQILKENVYVDDLMFGSDNINTVIDMQSQVRQLLMAGGFHPHKWASNSKALLVDIPLQEQESAHGIDIADEASQLKILGIYWRPESDAFSYRVAELPLVTTKRAFLSFLSKFFDPLGWVAPATISAKALMQSLWLRKLDWDEPLPKDLAGQCQHFQQDLPALNQVQLPRWTGQLPRNGTIEIHGFCDASNTAYAAVLYLRIQGATLSEFHTSLLYAKTKVAPLKVLSVPRLELCAATLLTRALEFVITTMKLTNAPVYCWSDSTVVLAWLDSAPAQRKVFVANRVSEIQTSFPKAIWRHVPTSDNPADCASRGIPPTLLISHPLWWHGPAWLRQPSSSWPKKLELNKTALTMEQRQGIVTCLTEISFDLPDRVSSWGKLLRVMAYVLRFVHNSRQTAARATGTVPRIDELRRASRVLCKYVQLRAFAGTVAQLKRNEGLIRDKALRSLSPFIDADGIIRVGGRLTHSALTYAQKHPILLPPGRLSELIIRHMHHLALHGGLQTTLRLVRQEFWILRARNLTKRCVFNCVTCTRYRAQVMNQRMGELPAARVTPSRPFTHTGVDYAGPFQIRSSKGRGHQTHKAYCAVFVCLAVRAIHLECVDDYSTAAFLAAFDRFCARRGLPATVLSDNGTNFVGAQKELAKNFVSVTKDPALQNRIASDGIEWKFIPPAAPQFGGLWEAGVKSAKHHLRRILGKFTPTFEEFATLLCKIECVLNSRPLAPLYDNVESFDALTPGHFLVGSMLKTVPAPTVLTINENRLSRWQTLQRMQETFWKTWSSDFLNSLQQRVTRHACQPNLQVGDLVVMRAPNLPPAKWELGRIVRTFPGADHLVRVAVVKTAKSEYKRPITQLIKLPIATDTDSRNVSSPTLAATI